MATFVINATTTVADLKQQFRDLVGGTLRVYKGGSQADPNVTLVSLGAIPGTFECRTSLTVGSFEKSMLQERNLKVKVYPADDWVKVLDGITLSGVKDIPKQTTRKQMLDSVAYKREKDSALPLPAIVEADIRQWLDETVINPKKDKTDKIKLFHNELDMQVDLTIYLRNTGKYDEIQTEYFIDKEVLPDGTNGNVWERHFNLDIVLCRGDEWFVIEMKYKTTAMDEEESERFGEKVDFATLKNQGATNYGMYGFWKDVRRIEIVKQRFSGVVGGIALFVTNDEKYWEGHKREDAGYANFSMAQGSHGPEMKWTGKCEKENDKKEHHEFTLEHSYNVEWSREGTSGFRYVILQVPPAEDK